ncbi:hypothetical protein AVEN_76705-1 [Araneus ventricosus]|uniref:Uncharacterized protein n=1 Tax=Araneus ventricosus TaxID=182803 RepID=A0A4Y2BS09_ARAVE|nr:hypothetical protein AVEN_76705-1 [Araneus ventricosus]
MTRATPDLAFASANFLTTPLGGCLVTMYKLTCNRSIYTADIQWNRVSNLEQSGPEAETLPLDVYCITPVSYTGTEIELKHFVGEKIKMETLPHFYDILASVNYKTPYIVGSSSVVPAKHAPLRHPLYDLQIFTIGDG